MGVKPRKIHTMIKAINDPQLSAFWALRPVIKAADKSDFKLFHKYVRDRVKELRAMRPKA